MFSISMRKLHNIRSANVSLESSIRGLFWRCIQFQDQPWGLWEISKNVTTVLRNIRSAQEGCRRNMHIHEWTQRRSGEPPTARAAFRLRMLTAKARGYAYAKTECVSVRAISLNSPPTFYRGWQKSAAPLVWIWDPVISRKLIELESWNFTCV